MTVADLYRPGAPGSPEWWRSRLCDALDKQAKRVTLLEKYYDGEHPLPDPPRAMDAEAFAEAKLVFRYLSRMGTTNWVRMISRAVAERLIVRGFRFGEAVVPDADAWRLWQINHLDSDTQLLHDTVFSTGQAYGLVWPQVWPPEPTKPPTMTLEHPSQVIVAYAAGSRRDRRAALKRWQSDDGRILTTLYMPDWVYKWQTRSSRPEYGAAMGDQGLEERHVDGEEWPLANPLGTPPVIEFAVNTGLRARPFGGGVSEFEPVLPIQDRISKGVFDRLVTGEHQAFRQRYTIGWTPPTDPKTRQPDPRAVFRASQSKLWTFPKETVVGEFGASDFTWFVKAYESDINAMAAITQTPPHYLLGAMVNISGDALTAAESGLSSKAESHAGVLDEPYEEFIRLGLRAWGNKGAEDQQSQIIWKDFERRTWGETIDGLTKLSALGVPVEELWAMVPGVTPQAVRRWEQLKAAQPEPDPTPPEGGDPTANSAG